MTLESCQVFLGLTKTLPSCILVVSKVNSRHLNCYQAQNNDTAISVPFRHGCYFLVRLVTIRVQRKEVMANQPMVYQMVGWQVKRPQLLLL